MKIWNNLIVVLLVVAALLVIGLFALPATGFFALQEQSDDTIRLGFVGALTTDYASYGVEEQNAIQMALDKINSEGGILGKKLVVAYEDGKCNGLEAVSAAQKLVEMDNVKIILGGSCSTETLAMAPVTEAKKVILFSSFSSNPSVTNSGDYVFRNCPTDYDGASQIAGLIVGKGFKKIALLSENTDFAQGVRSIFSSEVKRLGAEIVADEVYGQNARDFKTQLIKIKASGAEVVFFNAQTDVSGGLSLKQAKELGIDAQYFGYYVFSSKKALENAGAAANGLLFADVPSLSRKNSTAMQFLDEYSKEFGAPASEFDIGARYDSVFILKNAIEQCKGVDSNCIRDYLYSLDKYEGIIGDYGFDKNGDVTGIKWSLKKVVDAEKGEVVLVDD